MTTPGRAKGREDTQPQSPVAVAPPLPNRRNSELVLLGFAAVITTVALLIVEANQESGLQLDLIQFTVGFIVLFGGAHLAVRRYAPYADPLLLPVIAVINGLGLVMIHRPDLAVAADQESVPTANQQLLWTLIGVAGFVAVLFLVNDHRQLSRYGYVLGLTELGEENVWYPKAQSRTGRSRRYDGSYSDARTFSLRPFELPRVPRATIYLIVFLDRYESPLETPYAFSAGIHVPVTSRMCLPGKTNAERARRRPW